MVKVAKHPFIKTLVDELSSDRDKIHGNRQMEDDPLYALPDPQPDSSDPRMIASYLTYCVDLGTLPMVVMGKPTYYDCLNKVVNGLTSFCSRSVISH